MDELLYICNLEDHVMV